jgi:hypothetical protein
MTKYYSRWHVNPALIPTNPEERMKLFAGMLERVTAELKSGRMLDWGITPAFNGYSIRELDEKGLLAMTTTWAPFVIVDTMEPILTSNQALESLQQVGAAAKK